MALKELLIEDLQGLLHAETQLTQALPLMANAAHNPKLQEGFVKHLAQTETHIERLRLALDALGGEVKARPCKAMAGLVEAGQEKITEGANKDERIADLALIAAAQKVEHYEISGYGTARGLARLLGEVEVAKLLSHTLGDEETTDFLLTEVAKPILQEAAYDHGFKATGEHRPAKPGIAAASRK